MTLSDRALIGILAIQTLLTGVGFASLFLWIAQVVPARQLVAPAIVLVIAAFVALGAAAVALAGANESPTAAWEVRH